MKIDYLSLDGLTHFFTKLINKFATKDELNAIEEHVITSDEIDDICGAAVYTASEVEF